MMKMMQWCDVVSLSDVLIAVTDNCTQYNISDKMAEAGFTTNKHRQFFSQYND